MALLNFRKKKEEQKTLGCCRVEQVTKTTCIKVLGAGCKSCNEQYENVRTVAQNIGLDIEIEYITDMKKVMEYGVMRMPAIVINETVVSMGKVLKNTEIEKLLHKYSV